MQACRQRRLGVVEGELGIRQLQQARIGSVADVGGRIDHALANMLLLAMPALRGCDACIAHGAERIVLVDARFAPSERVIEGRAGDTVSLLPFGGNALGVHTDGLQYPLHGDSLYVGPARGVSNVMLAARAVVRVAAGMLLCITTQAQ